ncbi:MaoC family dehydratase N-terminal domain-containing protein [Ensifer sp. ENS05]|uniref:FAS1-like dehydratase domain-containing protein n=1 Tax=Ensifer sp. ENS05 TaxID=2769277 RepID=UPI001786CFF7|nr:MaoC family dehydratase N-terminal domain-containing protein [Ensifer sp. ENS05]MBD9597341.1 MaoC family dehydratase N-terminal domain-containing protein [Ensifer sp. ENS05]
MRTEAVEKFDLEAVRAWIGREERASDIVSVDLVRKFNATLDLSDRAPAVGDIAPLLINYCLAQPAALTNTLGEDGHPKKGGFLPPIPLPRRMWAGSTVTFHQAPRVGDMVQRVSRISDIVLKEGRSGVLCFVTVTHRFEVGGKLVTEEIQDIVYREADTGKGVSNPAPSASAPRGTHTRRLSVTAPLLFRYSALTFNGHRIHYDRRYATEIEHYPGLVVHGPLQATALLNLATELKGTAPLQFSFRGQSPLFDDDRIYLHAEEEAGKVKLWSARENGPIAMSAEAIWS